MCNGNSPKYILTRVLDISSDGSDIILTTEKDNKLCRIANGDYGDDCDNGLFPWQGVFPLWTLTGGNEREWGLTGWTTALDWELARSDSLAAGKELVTGSKVPSDLLQPKSGHSENLDFTHLFFVLHYSSSKYNSSMKRLDVNRLVRVRTLLLSYNSN